MDSCSSVFLKHSLRGVRLARFGFLNPAWGFVLMMLLAGQAAGNETLEYVLQFGSDDVRISKVEGYDRITLPDCDFLLEAGAPEVPVRSVQIALPAGMVVGEWVVEALSREPLPQDLNLVAVQPPRILSLSESFEGPLMPVASEYYSEESYPERVGDFVGIGMLDGQAVAEFVVYPIRYWTSERRVELCTQVRIVISLAPDAPGAPQENTPGVIAEREKDLLLNPEVVRSAGAITEGVRLQQVLPAGRYEYLIVTSDVLASSFEPLAAWKTQKGVPARVVTTSEVQSYGFGGDLQNQIRTFLQYAAEEWGVIWVLLGGDTNQVPERRAYAMDSGYGANANAIPCDLYYADLDGDWNADGDATYGEIEDDVDLYSDLFVGRATVENVAEAQTFVSKVLVYEKAPPVGYATSMLFFAQIEDTNPNTDSSESTDFIDEQFIPPRFDPITKLYQRLENESVGEVIAALNAGHHFVNHTGHAWVTRLSATSGQYIYNGDVDGLTNGDRLSILYSTGCWPGAFDENCIAEHFLNNPNGAGVACIFNSRYGWYAPGNPLFGYSDRFNQQYYKAMMVTDKRHLGEVLAYIKALYVPQSRAENVYRWHQYMLNLHGDPEMPVWLREPGLLTVLYPSAVPVGSGDLTVLVRSGSEAVAGARICVRKSDEPALYGVALTDERGVASLPIAPAAAGTLELTVTAYDHLPYEGTAGVETSGKFLALNTVAMDDDATGASDGNGDDVLNPGETVELGVTLENIGGEEIPSGTAELRCADLMVSLPAMETSFLDLSPGATGDLLTPFVFSVDSSCPDRRVLDFTLVVLDGDGTEYELAFALAVARPVVHFADVALDDSLGNGNSLAEPGETVELLLALGNEGSATAEDVQVRVLPDASGWVTLVDAEAAFPSLPPGEQRVALDPVRLMIDASCPVPIHLSLPLEIQVGSVTWMVPTLLLPVGGMGFEEDFESGAPGWSHGGSGDLWCLDDYRAWEGSTSAYCGNPDTRLYQNYMNCYSVSPSFVLPYNARLTFWRWYEVPIYGVNGLHVELEVSGRWEQLDFIGSGGALSQLLELTSDWFEESYDLSGYPAGLVTRLRFRFVSDDEPVEEGFYLDDVRVASQGGPGPTPVPTITPGGPTLTPTPTGSPSAVEDAMWRCY